MDYILDSDADIVPNSDCFEGPVCGACKRQIAELVREKPTMSPIERGGYQMG